jgi:predicted RNase H-like HicB family nuclease
MNPNPFKVSSADSYDMVAKKVLGFSVIIVPENKSFSAWSPDLDVASQGDTVKEATANLKEAIELHLKCLTPRERKKLLAQKSDRIVTTMNVSVPA